MKLFSSWPHINNKTSLLLTLGLIVLLLLVARVAFAQTENLNARDPWLKEGRLFTIAITPKSNKAEVFVSGNKLADFQFTKVGMVATLKMGTQIVVLTPKRSKQSFVLEDVPDHARGELELRLKYKDDEEKFNVNLQDLR